MNNNIVLLKDRLAWTTEEAATMCGVSKSTFSNWVREGIMPRATAGKRYSASAVRNALNVASSNGSFEDKHDPYKEWSMNNG